MTLKINYLDKKKDINNNKAFFVGRATKIQEFKGEIDDKTFKSILKFKSGNNIKEDKIISINQDLNQKIILVFDVKASNELEYEKLGAKFFDFIRKNEITNVKVMKPKIIKPVLFASFIHGAELKSYEFNLYKTKKKEKNINLNIDKSFF